MKLNSVLRGVLLALVVVSSAMAGDFQYGDTSAIEARLFELEVKAEIRDQVDRAVEAQELRRQEDELLKHAGESEILSVSPVPFQNPEGFGTTR